MDLADELDPDSAFEEDSESPTSSLGPESYDYRFENGRRQGDSPRYVRRTHGDRSLVPGRAELLPGARR